MTKKRFYIGVILIAIVHIALCLFFGSQKSGFHEDEYYTYWSVSCEDVTPANFTWHTGHELQQRFLVKPGEQFSYDMVIKNQAADVHPPLYYMALHTLMSLFPGRFYKWFGILLNLGFSLVTLVGIVGVFYYLAETKETVVVAGKSNVETPFEKRGQDARYLIALLCGLAYGISPSAISGVMLTRMYAMSTMWTVLYALVFVLLIKELGGGKKRFALLTLCGGLICYATFLTHYFSLLVPFFLTLFYCIYVCIRRKGFVRMFLYGISMMAAIGLGILSYPVSLQHIFADYRGEGAIEGLLGASWQVVSMFGGYINNRVFASLLIPCLIVFVAALVYLVIKRVQVYKLIALTVTCGLSFLFLCQVALRVGEDACRYFYPVMALIIPLMAYVIVMAVCTLAGQICCKDVAQSDGKSNDCRVQTVKEWIQCGFAVFLVCIVLFPYILGLSTGKVAFLYRDDAQKVAFSQAHKEYPLIMVYSQDKRYRAWYVDNQLWPYDKILYMEYQYKDLLDDKTLSEAEKIVVYMDAPVDLLDTLIANNPKLSKYTLVRHDPYFYVYLVE